MSRVDILNKAKNIPAVKFKEFTAIVRNKDAIAIFFEGEDEKYYSIRIHNIRPDFTWFGINCEGKENVLELRSTIKKHTVYKNARCLFFVDADFDDNSMLSICHDIYITPCYSIENFYISLAVLKSILRAEFQITEYGEEQTCFEKAVSQYEECKNQYLSHILDFNCWIRSYRLLEKAKQTQGRLNLNELRFDNIIRVKLDKIEKVYDCEKIQDLFPHADKTIAIDTTDSQAYFANTDKTCHYRGKQNLEFFIKFLTLLKDDRCEKKAAKRKVFNQHGKVSLTISKANALSELSQYADTPDCLRTFLEKQSF